MVTGFASDQTNSLAQQQQEVVLSASPLWTEAEREAQRRAAADLQRKLSAALAHGDRHFLVPPGDYRFDDKKSENFLLENVRGFEIEATGATFWFGAGFGVRLRRCEKVTIRGLVIDMDPLPWWQGAIVAIDPVRKTMDVELDLGYALPGKEDLNANHRALFFDRDSRRELFLFDEQAKRLSLLGGNRIRVEQFSRDNPFVDPLVPRVPRLGDKLVINNERFRGGNLLLEDCADMMIENVSIYGAGGFAFNEVRGVGGNTYRNCRLIRRPGSNRLMASRGDGFHSSSMEKGPLIEGCEFSFAGDDLLAVQGFFSLVMSRPGTREFLIASLYGPSIKLGSKIEVYHFPDGASLGAAKIEALEELTDDRLVEAARRLPERALAEKQVRIRKLSSVKVYRLKVDRDLPGSEFDLVGCANYSGAGAIIRNNHLHDGHIRGVLIKSHDVAIENNIIERTGHGGIVLEAELYWLEGPFNTRIKVTNNVLRDIGGGALSPKGISVTIAAIQVGNYFGQRLFPRVLTTGNQNTDIGIIGNEIIRPVTIPIWVRNSERVIIQDNRIKAPFSGGPLPSMLDMSGAIQHSDAASGEARRLLEEPYFGIFLQNVSGAEVSRNGVSNAPNFYRGDFGAVTLDPIH